MKPSRPTYEIVLKGGPFSDPERDTRWSQTGMPPDQLDLDHIRDLTITDDGSVDIESATVRYALARRDGATFTYEFIPKTIEESAP